MKSIIQKIAAVVGFTALSVSAQAQCPSITCASDITVANDASFAGAIVTYTMPTAVDACSGGSLTFAYTGAEQTFVVPAGITSITVDVYGAQGGANWVSNTNYGGYVQADVPVTPGSTIYVYVGGQATSITGGWNGGGNGESAGMGGGGASDIRIGGNTYAERIVVAGGAGGGGYWSGEEIVGGFGGGLTGGPGYRTSIATPGGDPGTQVGSGNGTCSTFNNPICTGGFGYGGSPSSCGCEGYGGGGGWYGGAGSGNCRGGGGGSGYTDPTATNVTHTDGVRAGNGEITISWGTSNALIVNQIAGLPSGSFFGTGTTVNTFTAESGGIIDTCSFIVTVQDTEPPSITCPANIEICEGDLILGSTPIVTDNDGGSHWVSYDLAGATVGSGGDNVDGVLFNVGLTTVSYYVSDSVGNPAMCSFDVLVNSAPTVSLGLLSTDSMCVYNDPISLPAGTPAGGTYSGIGVGGSNFDPSVAGIGSHWVFYTYIDGLFGCSAADSALIVVDGCAGLNDNLIQAGFVVYPNPAEDFFMVEIMNQSEELNVEVYDMLGKIIISSKMNNSLSVSTADWPSGLYMVRVGNTVLKVEVR